MNDLEQSLAKYYKELCLNVQHVVGGVSKSPPWCALCGGKGRVSHGGLATIYDIKHANDCLVALGEKLIGNDNDGD